MDYGLTLRKWITTIFTTAMIELSVVMYSNDENDYWDTYKKSLLRVFLNNDDTFDFRYMFYVLKNYDFNVPNF